MDLAPDTVLRNRYRIIRRLGAGGMGAVFLAYDTALEVQVAVKTNYSQGTEGSTQFLREARLLANLRHPNLPRVIDYFIFEQNQYLVMDFIPGDDLESLLQREGAQPLARVLDWAAQLSSALIYLHSQIPPVIHRDIKPANLRLTPDGQVALVDFGIAKSSDTAQATATGATGYTPGFAPPEQYGSARTGPYSDQYAMAATLYTLLANQRPSDSVQRVLGQAVLTPLHLLVPGIPPNIESALEHAMAPRFEDRFPDVDEFNQALHDPSFLATTPTVISPARGAAAAAPTAQPRAMPAAPGDKAVPRKGSWAAAWIVLLLLGIAGVGVLLLGGGGYLFWRARQAATPTALAVSRADTPQPSTLTPTAEPASPTTPPATATLASSVTPLPAASSTPAPSATPLPRPLGDGKRILFSSDRADGKILQLWTMKAALDNQGHFQTSELTQLSFDPGDKLYPAWSPDGGKIVYAAASEAANKLDLYLLDLAVPNAAPVNLTRLPGDDTYPAWSPDGKTIAWTNIGRFEPDKRAIYFMDANGENRKRISLDFQEYSPFWTPAGDWLLYVILARDHNYLFMRSVEGKFATPVPYDPSTYFGRLGEVADPTLARDGSAIAYTRLDGKRRQIYSCDYKGRGARVAALTADSFTEYDPTWSPDGQYIAFTSERNGNPEIYLMTSVGQLQGNLSQTPGKDIYPAWEP